MILGERCTRGCGFCSVQKLNPRKHDVQLDANEPANVARMAREMKLRYVVITSVNRDDLEDGGSHHFAETVREVRPRFARGARGSAHAGFLRRPRRRGARAGRRPARLQSQHGDGAAPVLARASAGGLPAVARRAGVRAAARARSPHQIGIHGGAGRDAGRGAHAVARPARGGHRRGHHRAVPATHAPQPAGGGIRGAAAVRRVSRVRFVPRFQGSVQRTAGAQFLHGRSGQRGSAQRESC